MTIGEYDSDDLDDEEYEFVDGIHIWPRRKRAKTSA